MPVNSPNILAIDPGTKEIGIAVLSPYQLEHYGVKTFKRRSPAHAFLAEVTKHIASLVETYQPCALAIEQTFIIQKNAALLNVTAAEVKRTAKELGLAVYEYAPTQVRRIICQSGRATKREVAKIVAHRFPELARLLNQRTKWEESYWANLFDAVAVGLVCMREVYGTQDS